jgi:carboxyl-terminal processing protease
MNRCRLITICVFALCLATPLAHTARAQDYDSTASWPTLTDADKIHALSFFWMEATYNFAYFHQVPDLNWDSAYHVFIPQVLATDNVYDYYRVLQRFAALLKDGHTSVNMPLYVWDSIDFPKLRLNEFEGKPVVVNVDRGLEAQLPIGTIVEEVNGVPYDEYLRDEVFPFIESSTDQVLWDSGIKRMLRGWKNTAVTIVVRRPDGSNKELTLVRNRDGIEWAKEVAPRRDLVEYKRLQNDIAYVFIRHFNSDSVVTLFEALLPELRDARAIIIDIRKNSGGNTSNGTAILGHFTNQSLIGSKWSSPQSIAAYRAWGSQALSRGETAEQNVKVKHFLHQEVFEGETWTYDPPEGEKLDVPVAVLIGRATFSAAEDFLIFADSIEQFTYIGEATNGSTGQPLYYSGIPGGGSWRICTKRDTYADGRDFVGFGVQPDISVTRTLADYMEDRDPELEAAMKHLADQIR